MPPLHESRSSDNYSPLFMVSVSEPSVGEKMPLQVASPDCAILRPAERSNGSENSKTKQRKRSSSVVACAWDSLPTR